MEPRRLGSSARRILAVGAAGIALGGSLFLGLFLSGAAAQTDSGCNLQPEKVAAPAEVPLGETVRVTLTLSGSCPVETHAVDAVLVIDESASMADAGKIDNAKAAARAFLDAMDLGQSRVGLVSFTNGTAALRSGLTHDGTRIDHALDNLLPAGLTNISYAIRLADNELMRDPQGARPAMIVLTDGRQTQPNAEPILDAAQRAKDGGITIATFCAGSDCDPELLLAASSASLYFDVPDMGALPDLYRSLAGTLQANGFGTVTIRDELPDNMTYVVGSAVPAPDEVGNNYLLWRFSGLPPSPITYLVRPTEVGRHPTNVVATAEFTDLQGRPGAAEFPVPSVLVYKPECLPQPVEVIFLVDDSNCLYGQLLNDMDSLSAIKKGAEGILDHMDLTMDKAAVIGFGDRAIVFQTLTHDRQAVMDGFQRVTMRDGYARLDLAFEEVVKEIESPRHDPNAQVVTVTVTDGPMMQVPEIAEIRGVALRTTYGVKHYAIGVGFVSQHSVLRAISEPGGYYEIPFGGDVITPMTSIGSKAADLRAGCPPDNVTPTPTQTPWRPPEGLHNFLPRVFG